MPSGFDFGVALQHLREGKRVKRSHWKNVDFIFLVAGSKFSVNRLPLNQFFVEGTEIKYRPHIDMCGIDGSVGVWTASNGDILASDWEVYE